MLPKFVRQFLLAPALVISILLSGCVRREGRNSDCKWPEEPGAKALDAQNTADRRHLRADVELAEELAVRYMDAHRRPQPGSSRAPQPMMGSWSTCFTSLVNQIGESHRVAP